MQRRGGDEKRLRIRAELRKNRGAKGQDARLEVARQLAVKGGRHLGLAKGEESIARRAIRPSVARQLGDGRRLELHLAGRLVLGAEDGLELRPRRRQRKVQLAARLRWVDVSGGQRAWGEGGFLLRLRFGHDGSLVSRLQVVANTHKLVIDHCQKVREIPGLEDAILVLSFESNLA